MSIAISASMAVTAVQALLRYRERVDEILVLREAAAELPFLLPPAPQDSESHLSAMLAFFETERGRTLLVLEDLVQMFARVKADPGAPAVQKGKRALFALYFAASDALPIVLGPPDSGGTQPQAPRESQEMRLAYYVVRSRRLSQNPALARLLLAAADTLLEVAGTNAQLFVADPRTRAIVETILDEFALKRDFDDDSAEQLVRGLLGATLIAASRHGADMSDEPVLDIFFSALAQVREELGAGTGGDEFVASLLTQKGFQRLLSTFLTTASQDTTFLSDRPAVQAILAATLREAGATLPAIAADPRALLGVLEVAIGAAAEHAGELLDLDVDGKPLLAAIAASVGTAISTKATEHALFAAVVDGSVLSEVFRAAVGAVAEHPDELSQAAGLDALTTQLVVGIADVLSTKNLTDAITVESLREIVSRGLLALANHPEALAIDSEFATNVLVSVLRASSDAILDGLSLDDLASVVDQALGAASRNLHLLDIDDTLFAVLEATGTALSSGGVKVLLTPKGRRDVLGETFALVAANPTVWEDLEHGDLLQPILSAVADGLAMDGTNLLSGPVYVSALRGVLFAVARRGRRFTDHEVSSAELQLLLTLALDAAEDELGRTLDGENIGRFLERIVTAFLVAPIEPLTATEPAFVTLVRETVAEVAAA